MAHRPYAALEMLVIPLQTIVEILRIAVFSRRQDRTQSGRVALGLVAGDPGGHHVSRGERSLEERLRGSGAAMRAQKDIDVLAVLVDGAEQVAVPPANLEERLVHSPL